MSYEIILTNTKKIESLLEKLGGTGRGLHPKATSIESDLPHPTLKSIRFIATIRNKVVHEHDFDLTDQILDSFENACSNVISTLEELVDRANSHEEINNEPIEINWKVVKTVGAVAVGVIALVLGLGR